MLHKLNSKLLGGILKRLLRIFCVQFVQSIFNLEKMQIPLNRLYQGTTYSI